MFEFLMLLAFLTMSLSQLLSISDRPPSKQNDQQSNKHQKRQTIKAPRKVAAQPRNHHLKLRHSGTVISAVSRLQQ